MILAVAGSGIPIGGLSQPQFGNDGFPCWWSSRPGLVLPGFTPIL